MNQRARTEIQQVQARCADRWDRYQSSRLGPQQNIIHHTFDLIRDYEVLCGYLYRVRADLPISDPFRRRLEDFVSSLSQELTSLQRGEKKESAYLDWVLRYRALWRTNFSLFLFTLFVFIASVFIGWYVTTTRPDYIAAFVSQEMIESILAKHRWFEMIQSNPFMDGILIAVNNIKVGILTFVLGAFFGIGGLALLMFNGAMVGALMAFCAINHFDEELARFIVGHGPLELSIIVAAAFSSFLFGRVFYMRPYALFRKRLGIAASDAGTVLSGILPWLLLAACLEVFVSPWNYLSFQWKVILGVVCAGLFWSWTFFPTRDKTKAFLPGHRSHGFEE
jgi:uncharacterized membrane protein SpoIIM required for sporulation